MISLRLALLGIAAMQGFISQWPFCSHQLKNAAKVSQVALSGAE